MRIFNGPVLVFTEAGESIGALGDGDGEIIERGTAQELIAKDGAFAAVWKLQTSDGQLDDSSYGAGEE